MLQFSAFLGVHKDLELLAITKAIMLSGLICAHALTHRSRCSTRLPAPVQMVAHTSVGCEATDNILKIILIVTICCLATASLSNDRVPKLETKLKTNLLISLF